MLFDRGSMIRGQRRHHACPPAASEASGLYSRSVRGHKNGRIRRSVIIVSANAEFVLHARRMGFDVTCRLQSWPLQASTIPLHLSRNYSLCKLMESMLGMMMSSVLFISCGATEDHALYPASSPKPLEKRISLSLQLLPNPKKESTITAKQTNSYQAG